MAFDAEDGLGDAVYRQLRIDAAEFLDDALRVDGVGGGSARVEHVDALPLTIVVRGDPRGEPRRVQLVQPGIVHELYLPRQRREGG